MRGFPKHINCRRDLENLRQEYPDQVKEWVQAGLSTYEGWVPVKKLKTAEEGITDENRRIASIKTETGEELYQEEYSVLPGNRLSRTGLTIKDAEKLFL